MTRTVRLVPIVLAALVLAGCGSGSGNQSDTACVIVQSGKKLCGEDGAAWCRQFAGRSGDFASDLETMRACDAVGVDLTPEESPGAEKYVSECVKVGGDDSKCRTAVGEAEAAGFPEIDYKVIGCVRAGNDPVDCVEEIVTGGY